MAQKLAMVSLMLVSAILSQPAYAQRGGGGGGGGHCGGGGSQSAMNSASTNSPYTLNSLSNPYALLQMQQQYAQQAMAMRQMYAMQMENQMLRNQMMQLQMQKAKVAQANAPANANGDSNVLLASKKNTAAEKKKARAVALREKQNAANKSDADKLAMNELK